ncbi:hypothetical protein [Psychrobacter sp. 16-MNA-CIBAN-0192]|uniref:hypothetical protein n=1 Tax=Psychrobacter sp. 16-MNA-CIBAN-0192 TaxID=3140448 RepID=UPI0033312753
MGLLSIGYDPIFIGTILDFMANIIHPELNAGISNMALESKNYATYKGSYFAYSQI